MTAKRKSPVRPAARGGSVRASPRKAIAGMEPGPTLLRFGFGAGISVVASLIGIAFNHRIGGLWLAFPAILPAALTFIERKEGTTKAVDDASGAIGGALALIAFAVVVLALVPHLPVLVTLLLAMLAWCVTAVTIYAVIRAVD